MAHPQSCKNPETCTLTYREHLVGFVLGVNAIPSRAVHRTPPAVNGYQPPDEPAAVTEARQRRWDIDGAAFKRMKEAGLQDVPLDGAADYERSLGG